MHWIISLDMTCYVAKADMAAPCDTPHSSIFYFFIFFLMAQTWMFSLVWWNKTDKRNLWEVKIIGSDIMLKLLCNCVWWLNEEWEHEREREHTHEDLFGSVWQLISTMWKPLVVTYSIKIFFFCDNKPNVGFIYWIILN